MILSNHIKIHDVEQGTPEWHALRKPRVTGSNCWTLLRKGAEEAIRANSKTFNGNFWTKRGHLLEIQAIELYERIHDVDVLRPGFITNDKYPNAGFSPDGIVGLILESKSFKEEKHLSINTEEDLPPEIIAQVEFGRVVTELEEAKVLLYHPPNTEEGGKVTKETAYKEIIVTPNKKIQANIRRALYASIQQEIQKA